MLVASDKGAGTTPANPDRQTIRLSPDSRPSPHLDNPSRRVWPTTSNLNQPVPTGITTWQPVVGLRDLYIKHGRTIKNTMGGTLSSTMLWDQIPAVPIAYSIGNLSTCQTN